MVKTITELIAEIKENTGAELMTADDPKLKFVRVPFNIPELDRILGGGLVKGKTHLFKGAWSSGKCVVGDTYVFTDKGIHTIDKYAKNLLEKQVGDETIIFDGMGNKQSAQIYFDGVCKVKKIVTKCSFSLSGTYDHAVLIMNKLGNLEFKKLYDIEVGDYVAIDISEKIMAKEYIKIPKFDYFYDILKNKSKYITCSSKWPTKLPTVVDEDVARLLGYLIGDGCGEHLSFTNMYDDLLDDFSKLSMKLFGRSTRLSVPKNIKSKAATINLRNEKYLKKWFKLIGYDSTWRSVNKEVPETILKSPPIVIANFLRGYFDCDAHIPIFTNGKSVAIYSKSIKLIIQVRMLLLSLGIMTTIKYRKNGAILSINVEFLEKFEKSVGLTCKERSERLHNIVKLPITRHYRTMVPYQKQNIKSLINKVYVEKGANVGNSWVAVKKHEPLCILPHKWDKNYIQSNSISKESISKLLEHLSSFSYLPEYVTLKNTLFNIKNMVFDIVNSVALLGECPVYDYSVPTVHHFNSSGLISHNTFLALSLIKNIQQANGIAAFVDVERTFDPDWAKLLGVDINSLIISQPPFGEKALDIVINLIKSKVDIVVLDSIASLVSVAEQESDMTKAHIAPQARMVNEALKKITVVNDNTVFIAINQERDSISASPFKSAVLPAGKGQWFFSSIILDIGRGDWIKDSDNNRLGFYIKCFTTKNKTAPEQQQCVLPFIFGQGIDEVLGIFSLALDCGKIEKQRNTFFFGDIKLGSRMSALETMRTNKELLERIKNTI